MTVLATRGSFAWLVTGLVLLASACRQEGAAPERDRAATTTPARVESTASREPSFEDRAAAAGLTFRNVNGYPDKPYIVDSIGPGACWLDFDRDGRLDLFLVQGSHWPGHKPDPHPGDTLYRSLPGGRFEDVTAKAGIREVAWGGGCAAGDIDNDGWPDLYVTNHGSNALWRNRGDGSFEGRVHAAGADDPRWSASALLADFDADGFLDLVVQNYVDFPWQDPPRNGGKNFCTWHGVEVFCGPRGIQFAKPRFLRNRGDGTFADETDAAGIGATAPAYGLGLAALDFDRDGRLDLYMANDACPNTLWRNLGDGRFEELALRSGAALSDSGKAQASMGVDAGDYDGDGWPDLFITTFSEASYTLYHNDEGNFTDVSIPSGVTLATYVPLGWGAKFLDFDDDGDLDLLAGNGHVYPQVASVSTSPPITYLQRTNLLRNEGGKFRDVADSSGPGLAASYGVRGLAVADYDNDGRLDALLANIDGPPALLHNSGAGGRHWLGIELEGRASNRDGFGAMLVATAPGMPAQTRWASPGGSFQSSSDPRVHFGLDTATTIDLEVHWPSGLKSRYPAIAADRYLRIVEGAEAPQPVPR